MQIGKKIKLLRNLKGFTQNALAEKINKTRALVSHIEQTGKINHYTLQLILKALGISADEFEQFEGITLLAKEPNIKYYTKSDINQFKKMLENCQKENEMLKELVASQKKIIGMIENKKRKG